MGKWAGHRVRNGAVGFTAAKCTIWNNCRRKVASVLCVKSSEQRVQKGALDDVGTIVYVIVYEIINEHLIVLNRTRTDCNDFKT